jgi:hypothetical protein
MAKVVVENALVERIFWEGKGAAVSEKFVVQGSERTRRWSIFFDEPHGLQEGQVISVQGLFSDKPETFQKKDGTVGVSSNLTINKPTITAGEQSNKIGIAAANEIWPTVTPGGAINESAPF